MENTILVLVGGGSQEALLRKMVNDSALNDRVIFAGRVEYAGLPAYYQAADLYVSASHSDGSSVSLMEALGCGCPVLVSDIIANREWVQTGNQGWLFKDGDWQDLAEGMLHAYQQQDILHSFRKNARQTAMQKADWKKNSLILLSTYDKVAGLNVGKDLTR
jgi:glycosyltransferase involved in cell wall biosynthesis